MLQFIGDDAAKAKSNAEKILVFETSLAKPTLDRVERRDRRKTYNPMSVSDLQKMFPTNNWDAYFEKMGLPKLDSVVVSQPKYLTALDQLFKENQADIS